MEHSFWHNKWENNHIAFHEPEGSPFLIKYAQVLLAAQKPRIFVPLCGKTRDIHWLLVNDCEVVGVELSEIAIRQLFEELEVTPHVSKFGDFSVYKYQELTVYVGDIFKLSSEIIGEVTGIYDRAALVALPEPLRSNYVKQLTHITRNAPQLLISFDYDQRVIPGPPFCVDIDMVSSLYRNIYNIELLERAELEGGLKRKVAADSLVFKLTPKE